MIIKFKNITSNCLASVCLCLRASSVAFLMSDDWLRDCSPLAFPDPAADGEDGLRLNELGNIDSEPNEKPVLDGGGVLFSVITLGLLFTSAYTWN